MTSSETTGHSYRLQSSSVGTEAKFPVINYIHTDSVQSAEKSKRKVAIEMSQNELQ